MAPFVCQFLAIQSNFAYQREIFFSLLKNLAIFAFPHFASQKIFCSILQKPIDPGTLNKLFTRSGYLFLMEKKALGTTWNKYYCHYQRENKYLIKLGLYF